MKESIIMAYEHEKCLRCRERARCLYMKRMTSTLCIMRRDLELRSSDDIQWTNAAKTAAVTTSTSARGAS